MPQPFYFKQFTINQQHSAMKVGTDGVLLGAWINPNTLPSKVLRILDIGTGTGLIALMCAQRFVHAHIDAIEIDEAASVEARNNVQQSPFANQVHIHCVDAVNYTVDVPYELIVCNPPYFVPNTKALTSTTAHRRQTARQTVQLSFKQLLTTVQCNLAIHGIAGFILPIERLAVFMHEAAHCNLYAHTVVWVKGSPYVDAKRVLITLCHQPQSVTHIDYLTLELARHQFTAAHRSLVRDFYRHL